MLNIKKKLSVVLAAVLMTATFATPANAAEVDLVNNTGVNPNQTAVILEDRLEEIKNDDSMSDEEKQRHIEKVEYLIELRDSSKMARAAYTPPHYKKTLNVPYCMQEEDYYCGPATAQQTYKYYSPNYSPSQKTIAGKVGTTSSLGTDLQPILDYLNTNIGTTYEQSWLSSNATNYEGSIKLICDSIETGNPPIMWVSVSSKWGGYRDLGIDGDVKKWPYIVGGHYLNASGYDRNGQVYEMTDPWIGKGEYKEAPNGGKFWVDNYTTYMVTNVASV